MKANINYKSKKAIIITIILVALIAITTIAVMLFVKGNDNAEAIDGNTVENTINNNASENNSYKNDEEKEQNNNDLNNDDKEQENDINNEENTNNNENENETQENEKNNNKQENTNNNVNNNQENTNNNGNQNNNQQNTNNNQGNIPNQEFVTERVEIIPERVIAENYYVSWKPTQFETLINGTISFEKADITAEKTVAKVTENGFEQNPESVKVGEILQYTITLTNNSNKVNGIINVKDEIPEGTEFITATNQNLETIPAQYENSKDVKSLEWKNIKVEAGSKVELVVYVKVVAKVEEKETIAVKNIATIYEGTTEEEVPSPETKVANITANKTSKIIYNKEKPHEHIIENGKEPLHEQDIIEYTITLTNVGEGAGTVKVSDTVPEGTTFIKDGVVTVVDQNGTKTFEISDLEKGINVTVSGKADETVGTATVTFRVIVNVLETETKVIRNEMAKVDNESTNTTEDIAEKLYIDFKATKVWENTENDAAKENEITSITLQLKANGEVAQEVAVTEKENWTHIFTNLNKYDENGNEIVYEIDEKVTFEQDEEKLEKYNKVIDGNTITNTFDPSKVQDETVELTATKVWENTESDAAKDYAITSIILQVRVYGQDGAYALAAVKEVTEKENWTHTFEGLKKYDVNGNEIKYVIDETVNEEDTEKLEKYDKVVEGNTITNTFNPNKVQDKTEITVAKVWEDDNNKAGVRPENVEFVLVQDGQETDKKLTANEATGWKVVFENLNKYTAEGKEIVYTIKEVAVDHYTTEYSEYHKTVTNTIDYTSIKTSKTITKIWEDNSNKYETRPQNVVLSFNGVNYTLTAGNDENKETTNEWTLTIKNLQKYDAQGNEIIYTVTEPTVPTGYIKTENGLMVTNVANEIVEKTAHKANNDGTIGNEATNTDVFKANDVVYYKLTFKNAGNTVIENKTLTDTLPARLKLLAVAGTEITENSQTGTDSYGYTWQVSKNNDGNVVIDWSISSIEAGESKELVIKAQVQTEYKDLCQKNGNQTENTAKLNIVKDGTTVNSVGTVYLNTAVLPELEELLPNSNIEKMLKNNNSIVDIVEKGTTRDAIKQSLQSSGIALESDEVILWYAIKNENNEKHIYGEIRKISEITTINNAVYMDNQKQDEVEIKTEDIEIGQSGTVTVNVTSTTTATVSNPMDVVFVIDTSGSMQGTNATNMVNAVNKSIKTIMAKNADTKIGIVGFSGNSSQSITNASTIIPLGKYAQNTNYLRLQNNTIYSTVTNNSRAVTGGTNTGAGIKAGAEMLTSQTTTTFTTTVNGVTVTGTRTPVLILVTDGEPTYYYENEMATGTRKGNGQNTDENYYYWTIRNAKYYKDAITTKYYAGTQKQAKVFTIGIGMSGELATTMLNPNQTNVDSCNDNTSGYRTSEKKRLYNLLNSDGTPYAYSYADGSKTGELTETDIENFLTSSLNASVESMEVRAITTEESKARRINLENIDTSKPFLLEIIEETPIKYTTLAEAQSAGYVKIDTETNMYYVDLSNITRETTININYWEE